MNIPNKQTAIFSLAIFVLSFALVISMLDCMQKVKMAQNDHQMSITEYDRSIDQRDAKIKNLVKMINIFTDGNPVLVTAYNAHENQTDSTPTITASNESVVIGGMALSRDFLEVFDRNNHVAYGDTVLLVIPMRVNDTMNDRYLNRADVFLWNYSEAIGFGVREGLVYHE